MIKIALISDLHANIAAFDAVLDDISKTGVDEIICLGDIASLGPQPREIVARVRELGCSAIQGNHDVLPPDKTAPLQEFELWTASQLSPDDLAWLTSLPATLEVQLEADIKMLCVHGSPRSFDERILAETPRNTLDEMLIDCNYKVIACGHTHIQLLRRHNTCSLVNVGSVAMPFVKPLVKGNAPQHFPWAEYGIVSFDNGQLGIDLRQVEYNFQEYCTAIKDSSMPYQDWWTKMWV